MTKEIFNQMVDSLRAGCNTVGIEDQLKKPFNHGIIVEDPEDFRNIEMGGYYGYAGGCSHQEVPLEEAVQLCIDSWGGASWQDFILNLAKKGIGLYRK